MQSIQATIDHERAVSPNGEGASLADCFRGTDLRRTRIIILLNTLQQLLGVSLLSNAAYFLIMAGMSPTQSLTISQVGVGLGMATTFITWFTMTVLGRRFLILASTAIVGVLFLTMGIAAVWSNDKIAVT
jgi:SP family general alpha glucoside:H+ symporter-like MFS transporter